MQLWHVDAEGSTRVIADTVEVTSTRRAKARGLMLRESFPEGHALVFPFDAVRYRGIHMLFVRLPIVALWLDGETVTKRRRLRPWIGLSFGRGDTVIELPVASAEGIDPGDRVVLTEEEPAV